MTTLMLLAAAVSVYGTGSDGYSHAQVETGSPVPGAADISLTLDYTFEPEGKALGLYMIELTALCGVNNDEGKVYGYEPTAGGVSFVMDLDPGNASSCFGVIFGDEFSGPERFYTNDWNGNDLYYTLDWGASWNTVFDPAFSEGRGMDYDGAYLWSTYGYGKLVRFQPETTPFDTLMVPETSGQLSGLTVFPWEGDLCVAVTSFGSDGAWFYLWDGAALEYLGFGSFPVTSDTAYGLAYSEDLETLFLSYEDYSGDFWIAAMSLDISAALEQSTWGAVKASF